MSIEKERGLFELWCIKDDEFCIHRYAGSGDYSDDYTQCAWMAWQASANRQGYKLVPVEPSKETIKSMLDAYEEHLSEGMLDAYKAMIGAIE